MYWSTSQVEGAEPKVESKNDHMFSHGENPKKVLGYDTKTHYCYGLKNFLGLFQSFPISWFLLNGKSLHICAWFGDKCLVHSLTNVDMIGSHFIWMPYGFSVLVSSSPKY
jgi:hypothetical protein